MPNSIQHVNVMVDDLATANEFFETVLGLDRATTPEFDFPAQFFVVGGGQELHVNELHDLHPERSHYCLRVDDFTSVFRRALERGVVEVETWGKARRLPSGVIQAFIRDPAGNLIEISCNADQDVDPAIFELDVFDHTTV
jgi:lactoylglutathione lyase